jgi:hypothetical protein
VGKKPFVMNVTFEEGKILSKAGENYLFSVEGKPSVVKWNFIRKIRVLPVEIDYPHYYTNFKIKLPKGASVKI